MKQRASPGNRCWLPGLTVVYRQLRETGTGLHAYPPESCRLGDSSTPLELLPWSSIFAGSLPGRPRPLRTFPNLEVKCPSRWISYRLAPPGRFRTCEW